MYLRFTTTAIDEDSRKPRGVFMEALLLLDSGNLDQTEWQHLKEILDWFNKNLPTPPKKFVASRAIFWFKPTAEESISRIWDMVHILRRHDRHVVVHRCRRLANISYSDRFQVAAYPSALDDRIIES